MKDSFLKIDFSIYVNERSYSMKFLSSSTKSLYFRWLAVMRPLTMRDPRKRASYGHDQLKITAISRIGFEPISSYFPFSRS